MSETVRVARVAIKTEVIPRSESVGTAYKVTVGRLSAREKAALIDALSKVSASSCEEVECPKGASGTGISFEMYSTLKEITRPTWVCNDAVLEFQTGEFCQHRLNLVRLDDFSESSPTTPWFVTDEEDEEDEEEELEHVTANLVDAGIEVLDLEFAGGNRNCPYWAKIRLFDLSPSEVERVKRVYERDPEDLPTRTRCGERLERGFELEFRTSREHSTLKEVTVVLYCKNYEPLKEIGAYSRSIDATLDYCEGAICPVLHVNGFRGDIKVLEPEKRFGYVNPVEDAVNKEYFFADILCQKIGGTEGAYTIGACDDKTKVMFISTATEFNQRDSGLGNLISEARKESRIYIYDNGAKMGDYMHGTFVPFVQDCIEATAKMELPCRAIFESSNPPKLTGMIFIAPSYAEHNADNLPTVQLLDETLIKMCIRDGHLKEEDQAPLYKDIEKRSLNEKEETTMPGDGEFPRLTLEKVLVIFHRDCPQFCHIGRMFFSERDRVVRTFDTDYAHSAADKYPCLTHEATYAEDILLRTERCCGIMPGVVYLMNRITFVRRWGHILIDDFEVATDGACLALNPVYYDMWKGRVPQAAEDTHSCADERADRGAIPEIKKIEFHEPATIIFWKDGTKSVVQARDGEPYDAEKGIAMAIAKKALGNERGYYNTFIHWLKRYKKKGGKR